MRRRRRTSPPPRRSPRRSSTARRSTAGKATSKSSASQDGAIVAGTLDNKIPRNEFLCTTATYGDFELRLKFKLLGGDNANAGVQFRTKRIPNNHEVSGYQADMGVGWWGALYDESRRNKVLIGPDQAKMKDVIKANDWNDYVIRAEGKHIQLWINGFQTVDYTEDGSFRSRPPASSPCRFTLARRAGSVQGHHACST